jgi:hypothetical protein
MGCCRLCREESGLSGSHILPRAFFKKAKGSGSQLVRLNSQHAIEPKLENGDWIEDLLCPTCEHFLNDSYESSQIRFLRNYKNTHKSHQKVTFRRFDFTKMYLFWLSIIWRASVSSLAPFETVTLGPELNEIIRRLIRSQTTYVDGVCFSEILQVGLMKVLPEDGMDSDMVNKLISSPLLKSTDNTFTYTILVEGFLVAFHFGTALHPKLPKNFGQIKKSMFLRIPRLQIHQSAEASEIFMMAASKAESFPNWRPLGRKKR